jgi:hypothetical protein
MKHFALIGLTVLAACAIRPEDIKPSYASPAPYQGMSCEQLVEEVTRVETELTVLYEKQRDARINDTVGVALTGVPFASAQGQDAETEIATMKGQQAAIRSDAASKGCEMPPPPELDRAKG